MLNDEDFTREVRLLLKSWRKNKKVPVNLFKKWCKENYDVEEVENLCNSVCPCNFWVYHRGTEKLVCAYYTEADAREDMEDGVNAEVMKYPKRWEDFSQWVEEALEHAL